METLIRIGLSNTLSASVLALLVLCLGKMLRRHPALQHSLWLLVLIKLVAPPLFEWPVHLPECLRLSAANNEINAIPRVMEPMAGPDATVVAARSGLTVFQTVDPLHADRFVDRNPSLFDGMMDVLHDPPLPQIGHIWLAGSLVVLCVSLLRIRRFSQTLHQFAPASPDLNILVDELARRISLRRLPSTWWIDGKLSPMVWALPTRQTRLLIPKSLWNNLTERQRAALILHELAHLRRGDHHVRLLELIVTTLYWWNPLVWWVRRALRDVEEQCCDAWVVWAFPESAKSYAETLLETLDFLHPSDHSEPLLASSFGKVDHLKSRLTMIMTGGSSRTLGAGGSLAALALAALLLPLNPAWARKSEPNPPVVLELRIGDPASKPTKLTTDDQKSQHISTIKAKLNQKITLDFDKAPLSDAVAMVKNYSGLDIVIDPKISRDQSPSVPVTLKADQIGVRSALSLMLQPLRLTYKIIDSSVVITTLPPAQDHAKLEVIDISAVIASPSPPHDQKLVYRAIDDKTLLSGDGSPVYVTIIINGNPNTIMAKSVEHLILSLKNDPKLLSRSNQPGQKPIDIDPNALERVIELLQPNAAAANAREQSASTINSKPNAQAPPDTALKLAKLPIFTADGKLNVPADSVIVNVESQPEKSGTNEKPKQPPATIGMTSNGTPRDTRASSIEQAINILQQQSDDAEKNMGSEQSRVLRETFAKAIKSLKQSGEVKELQIDSDSRLREAGNGLVLFKKINSDAASQFMKGVERVNLVQRQFDSTKQELSKAQRDLKALSVTAVPTPLSLRSRQAMVKPTTAAVQEDPRIEQLESKLRTLTEEVETLKNAQKPDARMIDRKAAQMVDEILELEARLTKIRTTIRRANDPTFKRLAERLEAKKAEYQALTGKKFAD